MSYLAQRPLFFKDRLSASGLTLCDNRLKTVMLMMAPEQAYVRQMLEGIGDFSANQPDWNFSIYPHIDEQTANDLPWRPDGIIGCFTAPSISQAVAKNNLPIIDLSDFPTDSGWRSLTIDEEAIGSAAAQHLHQRGYRHLGFVAVANHPGEQLRAKGFHKAVTALGVPCLQIDQQWISTVRDPLSQVAGLAEWLARSPRPLGLFCFNDSIAATVTTACQRIGAAIPDEIGILGCDNDHIICSLGSPPRSSLTLPHRAIGQRACEMLACLMRGESPPASEILRPGEVIVRGSTDRRNNPDSDIGAAIEWITLHLSQSIGVTDVAQAVSLSRRTLERRMRIAVGCTVLEVIHRARLARSKELLRGDQSIIAIAAIVGFSTKGFHEAFVRHLSVTPGEWRRRMTAHHFSP